MTGTWRKVRRHLALENLALRQQLAPLRCRRKRPRFSPVDRVFWIWLSKRWPGWRDALCLVRPETVIRWHRQSFRLFWTWKSRRGRPGLDAERAAIREQVSAARRHLAAVDTVAISVPALQPSTNPAPTSHPAKVALFASLFRGRDDVYPRFWTNERKGTAEHVIEYDEDA